MKFEDLHNDMCYFAGGPALTEHTVAFLQFQWDSMRENFPLIKSGWLLANWLPEEIYNEFQRNLEDVRYNCMDDLDFEIHALTLAFSAHSSQSTCVLPPFAAGNGTAQYMENFMYALRCWNGVMDAHWAAA